MLANRVRMSYIKKGGMPNYVMATDSDFSGTANGAFRYIGSHEYVIIPHIIKGVTVNSYQDMFRDNTSTVLKGIASDNPNVTSMRYMFYNSSATTLDLSSFDTSNVTTMYGMFQNSSATTLDLSSFDTSNVNLMGNMFYNCNSLTSLDLSSFDTFRATSMREMFYGCRGLTSLDLSSFDTSKVSNVYSMFRNCTSIITDYARTQADADKFNASSNKHVALNFVVIPKYMNREV